MWKQEPTYFYLLEELVLALGQGIEKSPRNICCWVCWTKRRGWESLRFAVMRVRSSEGCLPSGVAWVTGLDLVSYLAILLTFLVSWKLQLFIIVDSLYGNVDFWSLSNHLYPSLPSSFHDWGLVLSLLWILPVPQSLLWGDHTSTLWTPVYTCPVILGSLGKLMSLQGGTLYWNC